MSSTSDPANLDAVFKAYDVRGTVPDQIDEDLARAVGAAFVAVTGADASGRSSGTTCGRPRRAWPAPSPRAPPRPGADVVADRAGLDRPALLRLRAASGCPARCSPPATTRRSTTASRCAARGAVPVGMDTGLAEIRDLVAAGDAAAGRRPGTITEQRRARRTTPPTCSSLAPVTGRPLKVVVDAGNGMAGHTAPAVFDRLGRAVDAGADVLRARRHLPQPRGQPDRARRTCVDLQARVRRRGRRHRPRLRRRRRPLLPRRRARRAGRRPSTLTALIAARELAKEPGATVIHNLITSRAVPEIVTELGGTPGAHPGRPLLHQGHDGRDRRDLRRRAQRPLLLPRLLARRLRHAGRAARAGRARRDRPAAVGAAGRATSATSRAARSTPRVADQAGRRSPSSRRRTPAATASTSTTSTG